MKMRIVIVLLLIAGLVGVQGCRTAGGEWLPKHGKPARKQTLHDKANRSNNGLPELIAGVIEELVNKNMD